MNDSLGRIFGAVAALAALWIVVYWWWEPRPRISFDTPGPSSSEAAVVTPPPPIEPRIEPAITPVRAPVEPPAISVVPPRFRDYTIRSGETLEAIAERELGSRRHVAALRAANPLMDPERIKPGRIIRIPLDPSNIQGKPVVAPPEPAPEPSGWRAYTVKRGDTLSGIAKSQYGSTRFVDLIVDSNKGTIRDGDDIREGMTLRLPPKPN